MVICFVTASYPLTPPFGGIAVYTQTAARALSAKGHKIHVLVGWRGEVCDKMDGPIHVHYRRVRWLPLVGNLLPGLGESIALTLALRRLHTCYHFDIVEVPNYEGHGLLLRWWSGVPVVVRLHTSMHEIIETKHRQPTFGERYMIWAEGQSARWASGVVTHSNSHRDRLSMAYGLKDIQLITHGIQMPKIRAGEPANLSVLVIGPLTARKGGDTLLAAIAQVCTQITGVAFTIVGTSDDDSSVRRFRDEHPTLTQERLVCIGFVSNGELDALFATASVYASASIYESFGLTFVEAMARGIPVVGCAISAMNEIIANGRTGLLVPPSDPEAFAAAIISLLLDAPLRNRLGDQGRQVAVEHYSAERMAFEMELWYRKILLDLGHITPEGGN